MIDPITLGIFAAALLVEAAVFACWHRAEMERERAYTEKQLGWAREHTTEMIDVAMEVNQKCLDRLQARSLGEYKALTEPMPEPPPAEAVDPDWEEPSFARPDEGEE